MPQSGYCEKCSANVWITPSGTCSQGHSADGVSNTWEAPQPPTALPRVVHCRRCGTELFESVSACGACGFRPLDGDAFCRECGVQTQPGQAICTTCGSPLPQALAAAGAPHPGATGYVGAPAARNSVVWSASSVGGPPTVTDWSRLEPYWQNEFQRIYESGETYRGRFNWAAFLFGSIWMLVRDLPLVGLIIIGVCVLTSMLTAGYIGILLIPLMFVYWVYFGTKANYIRYIAYTKSVQAFVE